MFRTAQCRDVHVCAINAVTGVGGRGCVCVWWGSLWHYL